MGQHRPMFTSLFFTHHHRCRKRLLSCDAAQPVASLAESRHRQSPAPRACGCHPQILSSVSVLAATATFDSYSDLLHIANATQCLHFSFHAMIPQSAAYNFNHLLPKQGNDYPFYDPKNDTIHFLTKFKSLILAKQIMQISNETTLHVLHFVFRLQFHLRSPLKPCPY
jgi:hypothetical protein